MPTRKVTKITVGKRKGKMQVVSTKRYTVNVNKALQPIPQRYICNMKYTEAFTPINSSGQTVFRLNLNSIYDPNRTGLGHQPYGHDTFQSLYNRYRVISVRYIVSAVSSNGSNLQIATLPCNEEFSAPSISDYRENPRGKYVLQVPGSPVKVIKGKISLPSLTGRTKAQYMADDRYQAQFGASPSELMVLNCNAQHIDESLVTATGATFNITLVYRVELFDPKNLAQS